MTVPESPPPAPAASSASPHAIGFRDHVVAVILFGVLVAILKLATGNLAGSDPRYTLLLSEQLIRSGSFSLDPYFRPPLDPSVHFPPIMANGLPYQVERTRGHVYYHYPPGSSILSIPCVIGLNILGWKCSDASGAYRPMTEFAMQRAIATLLMAMMGVVLFYAARCMTGTATALCVGAGAVLASPAFSSTSRALWSDTWALLLVALAIWHLVRVECRGDRLRPVLLATVLAWTYFCRPTYSLTIIAVSVWVAWRVRLQWAMFFYTVTGIAWLALFLSWSWAHFGTLTPLYYHHTAGLRLSAIPGGLAGLLCSPARGLIVYSPIVLFLVGTVACHWRRLTAPSLVVLAAANIVAHLLVTAAWPMWWGGWSYGPRLLVATVPWFALIGAAGLAARRGHSSRLATSAGMLLLAASVAIHALGAWAPPSIGRWNERYLDGLDEKDRLWDWRIVPFLQRGDEAAYLAPLLRMKFSAAHAGYIGGGWGPAEGEHRWSLGPRASLCFVLGTSPQGHAWAFAPSDVPGRSAVRDALLGRAEASPGDDLNADGAVNVADLVTAVERGMGDDEPLPPLRDTYTLYVHAPPFLPTPDAEQRVRVSLNGAPVGEARLGNRTGALIRLRFPGALLRRYNQLDFDLPNAIAPSAIGLNDDTRVLAIYPRDLLIR